MTTNYYVIEQMAYSIQADRRHEADNRRLFAEALKGLVELKKVAANRGRMLAATAPAS